MRGPLLFSSLFLCPHHQAHFYGLTAASLCWCCLICCWCCLIPQPPPSYHNFLLMCWALVITNWTLLFSAMIGEVMENNLLEIWRIWTELLILDILKGELCKSAFSLFWSLFSLQSSPCSFGVHIFIVVKTHSQPSSLPLQLFSMKQARRQYVKRCVWRRVMLIRDYSLLCVSVL